MARGGFFKAAPDAKVGAGATDPSDITLLLFIALVRNENYIQT